MQTALFRRVRSYADCTPTRRALLCREHKGALPFWISRKDASLLDLDHFMETRFHLEGVKTCSLNNPPMPHKIFFPPREQNLRG